MTHYHIVLISNTSFVFATFLEKQKLKQIIRTYGVSRSGWGIFLFQHVKVCYDFVMLNNISKLYLVDIIFVSLRSSNSTQFHQPPSHQSMSGAFKVHFSLLNELEFLKLYSFKRFNDLVNLTSFLYFDYAIITAVNK